MYKFQDIDKPEKQSKWFNGKIIKIITTSNKKYSNQILLIRFLTKKNRNYNRKNK